MARSAQPALLDLPETLSAGCLEGEHRVAVPCVTFCLCQNGTFLHMLLGYINNGHLDSVESHPGPVSRFVYSPLVLLHTCLVPYKCTVNHKTDICSIRLNERIRNMKYIKVPYIYT